MLHPSYFLPRSAQKTPTDSVVVMLKRLKSSSSWVESLAVICRGADVPPWISGSEVRRSFPRHSQGNGPLTGLETSGSCWTDLCSAPKALWRRIVGTDKVQNGSKPSETSVYQCSASQPVARDPEEGFYCQLLGADNINLCNTSLKGFMCNSSLKVLYVMHYIFSEIEPKCKIVTKMKMHYNIWRFACLVF